MAKARDPANPDEYRRHSTVTNPGRHAAALSALPNDLARLVQAVRGWVIHLNLGEHYGFPIPAERRQEANLPDVPSMLDALLALDPSPLEIARPPERRLAGHCRSVAVLLCSLLREKGFAARIRAGFSYWPKHDIYSDHWLCEMWDEQLGRWRLIDVGLDDVLAKFANTTHDPFDVPADLFLFGCHSWSICRRGDADPDSFLFSSELRGWLCLQVQLLCDALSLTGDEPMAADSWGESDQPFIDPRFSQPISPALLDRVALGLDSRLIREIVDADSQ